MKLLDLLFRERRQRDKEQADKTTRDLEKDERIVRLVIEEVTKQRDGYKSEVDQLKRQVDNMELEIQGLRLMAGRDPFARWMVNELGKIMYINTCFEDTFLRAKGLTARDAVGKTHEALGIWSPEVCAKIHTLDELAKTRPDGRAKATLLVEGQLLTVYKLPVRHIPSGVIMGYEGWITDIAQEEMLDSKEHHNVTRE